mmetsp:Transcript_104273/g.334446  ORF Transcript_104273/g.334446 Transcript_104273/m.334446 type:complete len:216 (+) Transcript_104273:491-1138(+)
MDRIPGLRQAEGIQEGLGGGLAQGHRHDKSGLLLLEWQQTQNLVLDANYAATIAVVEGIEHIGRELRAHNVGVVLLAFETIEAHADVVRRQSANGIANLLPRSASTLSLHPIQLVAMCRDTARHDGIASSHQGNFLTMDGKVVLRLVVDVQNLDKCCFVVLHHTLSDEGQRSHRHFGAIDREDEPHFLREDRLADRDIDRARGKLELAEQVPRGR